MARNKAWRWLVLICCLPLLACAVLNSPADRHEAASTDFTRRLRWLDVGGAAQYLDSQVREEFLERFSGEDLRIVEFSLERVEFSDEDRRAAAWYLLEYHLLPSSTVRRERFRLDWEYREEGRMSPGTWYIVTPFPSLP
ncbi:hypothetical protein [Trichloromonas sp.]|uniref:hypothetical protein n=1 Tax=Trichloromonas sp. TaxID=3069249 RepID=UPI002A393620|nr:hypothetical protein [Trichloromonas sp.]